jgi:hypothetical protein
LQRSINREERLRTAEVNKQLVDSTTKFEILEQANVHFEMKNSLRVSKLTQKLVDIQTMINETKLSR